MAINFENLYNVAMRECSLAYKEVELYREAIKLLEQENKELKEKLNGH